MNDLRIMQLMLTDMLKVFHDFCMEHSLRYYAIGGTALGAARHHGFIPWDDDIDVGMPRNDYEKMINIFNRDNNNKRYLLESPSATDSNYYYPYSKLYDTQSTLIENVRYKLRRGLYIDIFPLDGAGKFECEGLKILKSTIIPLKIRAIMLCDTKRITNFNVYMRLKLFQAFLDPIIKINSLMNKIDASCKRLNYNESVYVANFMGLRKEKEIIRKEILGNPTLYPFENIMICCPEKIDEYLSCLYGDWKSPPPPNEQITHHDYTLDLNKPFAQ